MSSPNRHTGPFSRFEWLLATRYLRAPRRDAFASVISIITTLGIAAGVATLIVVMSVMNGFRDELITKIVGLNGHMTLYPLEQRLIDFPDLTLAIEATPGVAAAVPFVEGAALASSRDNSTSGVSVRGMEAASIEKLPLLRDGATLGQWENWDESGGVAIGARLANALGLSLDQPITLVNPNTGKDPLGTSPQVRSYPVRVIFDVGMVDFDRYYVFMPMRLAQDFFGLYDEVAKPNVAPPPENATEEERLAAYDRFYYASAIDVVLAEPERIDQLGIAVQGSVDRPLLMTDWRQRNESFFSAIQVQRTALFVILSLIILVAAFNIISSLVMLVKEKGADIAILRTMGATSGAVMRVFTITGTLLGVIGTALGVGLGLVIAANAEPLRAAISDLVGVRLFPPEVFYLATLPSRIEAGEVLGVAAVALVLSLLATIYPSWRAARYDPVEALRHE